MDNEIELLKKRLSELSRRSAERGISTSSEFLSLGEQTELSRMKTETEYELCGGFEQAERKLAVFGGGDPPISCLEIELCSGKFEKEPTHRDYLGSLMGLGLRRSTLGDIVIGEGRAWLFCLNSVKGHIIANLNQVGRSRVRVREAASLPEKAGTLPEPSFVNAASERLDAVVAAVYNLSRGESRSLFEAERVMVNGLPARSASQRAEPGNVVSVRGMGRFRFEDTCGETRKGRLKLLVRKY